MKKLFRWWGILAFLALLIVIIVPWLLFADAMVKYSIERYGTQAVGAKVELDSADLSLFPAGLKLIGLQITDPEEPMKNAIEAARISMALDTAMLLRRKLIISEMSLDGVQLNTPRKTSGAIKQKSTGPSSPEQVSAPQTGSGKNRLNELLSSQLQMPDVKEILKREDLKTLKLAQSIRTDIQSAEQTWQQKLRQLPDKEKLAQYRRRIKQLKSSKKGGLQQLLGSATDVIAIEKELEQDLDAIEQAMKDFQNQGKGFEKRLNNLAKAPMADIRRLKDKYSLSPQGLANLSALLLGDQIGIWIDRAIAWYNRLEPIIASRQGPETVKPVRGGGLNVRFKEAGRLPDFLIRRADASVVLKNSNLSGVVRNITSDQHLLGVPLTFNFSGQNLQAMGSIRLDGAIDFSVPSMSKSTVNLAVENYPLNQASLSTNPGLSIELKKALANLDLDATILNKHISSKLKTGLKSVKLAVDVGQYPNPITGAMAKTLETVKRINATAHIDGTFDDYDIQLKSDLDRILKRSVQKLVLNEAAGFEKKLKKEIFASANTPLKKTRQSYDEYGAIGDELSSRLNLAQQLLGGSKLRF
jgi:uncharacterized protein (TIGR03545 family)